MRILDGLMFYPIVLQAQPYFLSESEKYMEETIFSCGTISWYSPPFQNSCPSGASHTAEKLPSNAKIHLAKGG